MPYSPAKSRLTKNLDALMIHHWGKINKTRLATEAGVGQGTYDRIIEGTSIGLDVMEKLAAVFKLEAWQLIAMEMDPASPPQINAAWPFKLVDQDRYGKLTELAKGAAQMRMMDEVAAQEGKFQINGTNGP